MSAPEPEFTLTVHGKRLAVRGTWAVAAIVVFASPVLFVVLLCLHLFGEEPKP